MAFTPQEGDLHARMKMDPADQRRFVEDARFADGEVSAKIIVVDLMADISLWADRGDWSREGLNTGVIPTKADIVARHNMNSQEEADFNAIVAIGRPAQDWAYWEDKLRSSSVSVENFSNYQTWAEWTAFLQEAAKFDTTSRTTTPAGR